MGLSESRIRRIIREDLVERVLGMVLSGPDGAIQAGEILETLS